jgi:hypothetical protein
MEGFHRLQTSKVFVPLPIPHPKNLVPSGKDRFLDGNYLIFGFCTLVPRNMAFAFNFISDISRL